jgi:uncharacterized membrane protein
MEQSRWKSWALWLALAALGAFVVLNVTGIDISEPLQTGLNLLLPLLVAFGIINDPLVHGQLFGEGDQKWYQSWAVWLAIGAFVTYCFRLFFRLDIENTVNGLLDVLLPILVALGIVNNPVTRSSP